MLTAVVADDEPEIRELVAEFLVDRGFRVIQAADGFEALRNVKRVVPDILILDILMPRLGGIEALAYVRTFYPDVAVIVVTGIPDDALRGRAVALGAAALLPKPLALDLLGAIIDTVTTVGDDAARAAADSAPAVSAAKGPSARRILIADDDAGVRGVLRDFLEAQGCQVLLAEDGLMALRAVIDEPCPIVLLDIDMPRLGGLEALTAIRAIAPATQVIMISGPDHVELARRALAYGAFDYIMKPVDFAYLQRSIDAATSVTT